MDELILKYMGTGVMIHTIDSTECGIVKSYEKGWVTIEYNGKEKSINSEYMVTMEPYKIKEKKEKQK